MGKRWRVARPGRDTLETALKRRTERLHTFFLVGAFAAFLRFPWEGQLVSNVKVVRTYHYRCRTSFDGCG